jgi:prepilin-type N-terminal cleavage/methylation domain-containing protein
MIYGIGACRQKGFTLIETIMIIVLLGILASGILLYFVPLSASPEQALTVQAIELAQVKMEEIIADKKANGFGSIATGTSAENPVDPTYFPDFTRTTDVYYVSEADLDTDIAPAASDWKRVEVTVSWAGRRAGLVTVISDH